MANGAAATRTQAYNVYILPALSFPFHPQKKKEKKKKTGRKAAQAQGSWLQAEMRRWLRLIAPHDGCGSPATIHADTPNDKAMLYSGPTDLQTCSPGLSADEARYPSAASESLAPRCPAFPCSDATPRRGKVGWFLKMSYTHGGSRARGLTPSTPVLEEQCAWWADLQGRITRPVVNYNYAALHKRAFGHLCA